MAFYIYSPEPFPAKRKRNAMYQDAMEYLEYNGFRIGGPVPAKEWVKVPRNFSRIEYQDSSDTRGQKNVMMDEEWADAIKGLFGPRGVQVVEDSELLNHREEYEAEAERLNLEFRRATVEEFERQLQERKITGHGRAYPTSYEEECYELLDLPKPHSVEAFKAERMPGEDAAQRIADAIATALAEGRRVQEERLGVKPTGTAADDAVETQLTTARS